MFAQVHSSLFLYPMCAAVGGSLSDDLTGGNDLSRTAFTSVTAAESLPSGLTMPRILSKSGTVQSKNGHQDRHVPGGVLCRLLSL